MASKHFGEAKGRLCAALVLLAVAVGMLTAVAGCTPASSSPAAQPRVEAKPTASAPPPVAPTAAVPEIVPTKVQPFATSAPSTPPAQAETAIDARDLVLKESDLGPGWKTSEGESQPSVWECASQLEWSGEGSETSPEGLSAVSSQAVVHPDAASAQAAMKPLDGEHSSISAPEVGDASRAYTRSVNGGSSVVFLEAVQGSVWLRVGVYGDPRSEVKVPRAAQLAERMISRVPAVLTLEEHSIAAATAARPDRFEYSRLIDPAILEKRRPWREPAVESRVAAVNRVLAPFGYRIAIDERTARQGSSYFVVFEGDAEIASDVAYFGTPSVAGDGSDFAMVLESATGPASLLRSGSIEEWDVMRHSMTRPVLVGADLVEVVMDSQAAQQAGSQRFAVTREGEVVYPFDAPFVVDNPIKGLWSWGGHWVLEVDGQVVVDGESLNQKMGYEEIFDWQLLHGEPFYFFIKDMKVGLSYAGQELPAGYDEVIHYQCCEPAAFNVRGNDDMVWFHALRDGTWYYVEAGVFDAVPGAGLPPVDAAIGSPGPKD